MDILNDILLLLLLTGGVILIFVLVTVLRSVRRTLDTISADIHRLSDEAVPVLRKVQQVADQSSEALTMISENRGKLSAAAENIRKVTENIYRLENMLQEQLEPSVAGLARRLAGIRQGIDAFFETWRRR